MSYVSLLKSIPEFLSQPTGIAALASIGIHGAIAFLLPLVPVDSKPKQQVASSKTIGLVEFNQAEQNRLPQSRTPQQLALQPVPSLPQVPPPPSGLALQQQPLAPLPQASSTQLTLPPIPKSSTNLSIASLPKGQSLRIIPQRNFQVNPINSSINTREVPPPPPLPQVHEQVALGPSQPLPSSNLQELRTAKTPVELPSSNSPVQPVSTTVDLPASTVRTTAGSPSRLPQLQAGNIPADLRSVPSSPPVNTVTTATEYQNPNPPIRYPQTRQLVAPLGAVPQARDQLALAGASSLRSQLQSNPNIPQLPSLPKESAMPKTISFGEQFAQVKQQYPNIETKLPISGTINTKAGQEGRVDGALVVNSDGKVESVQFLDNSVSSDKRTAARDYLRQYFQSNPTQATGKPKYYPFSLSFRTNSGSSDVLKQTLSHQSYGNSFNQRDPRNRPLPQVGTSTQAGDTSHSINQNQASSEQQQRLIQKLRLSHKEIQPNHQQSASVSTRVRPSQKNEQSLQQRPLTQNSPQANTQSTSQPQISANQTSTSVESGQKLIHRLRQLRENRQKFHSNSEL